MKASDFFQDIKINDSELDDELEHLLDDPKSKPKKKGKKSAAQKPKQNQNNQDDAIAAAQAMLQQGDDLDNINIDDVELNSDDLKDLDGEFADIQLDEPKPKSNSKPKRQIVSDDDDDDDEVEVTKPTRPKYTPKKRAYKKESEQQKNHDYDEVFDYFSGNFYNFLFSVDEPKVADQYMSRMEDLAPIIFAGEEKFNPKDFNDSFLTFPKKIVPFGHWSNIKSKELNLGSIIEENKNVRKILNDQLTKLQQMKATANSKREEESVKEIDRAIKMTNQSLKAAFPKPEFLVSDYMQLQHSAINTSLSEKEIQVAFQSIKNCTCKDKYQISVEIPSIGKFQSRKLSGPNNDKLNDSYNLTYEPKRLQNAVSKGGIVSVGDKRNIFSLSELSHKSTIEIETNLSGTTVSFTVSIQKPLNGDQTTYEIQEFYCCPTILTEALSYTPQARPTVNHSPRPKPAPAQPKPAPAQPKPGAKANPPAPHLVILQKDELNLFWGTKATDILADPSMINFFKTKGYPVPQEYIDQVNFFIQKNKDFEKIQEEGDLDPNEYLADLKAALKREQDKLPSIPQEDKVIRNLLITSIQEEIKEIEEMLAQDE